MFRACFLTFGLCLLAGSSLFAQEEKKSTPSQLKVGSFMPGQFESFNINGPAAGRQRCLVCYFALKPSVLIFAKEPPADKAEVINGLLTRLGDLAEEFEDRQLSAGIVFLSPAARDSTSNADEKDAPKIIKETVDRQELHKRLKEMADKLKHVIVTCHVPEVPEPYDLKADVTIVFYDRMKILENWTYSFDQLQAKDVDEIVDRLRKSVPLRRGNAQAKKAQK